MKKAETTMSDIVENLDDETLMYRWNRFADSNAKNMTLYLMTDTESLEEFARRRKPTITGFMDAVRFGTIDPNHEVYTWNASDETPTTYETIQQAVIYLSDKCRKSFVNWYLVNFNDWKGW